MKCPGMNDQAFDKLQRATFGYFLKEANPANGLVPDNTRTGSHSSITAVGLALASYPIGVERGFISRAEAIGRTLTTLRFFRDSPQSDDPEATGCRGFYYHFLDMQAGRRAWKSEPSTIDTTFLLAGALLAAAYFNGESSEEREIRAIVSVLYSRADWQWAQNGGLLVSHGWKPEIGFLPYHWGGYSEALLLYVLGLGSPTHPLPADSYRAWTESYRWKKLYGIEFLYAGPSSSTNSRTCGSTSAAFGTTTCGRWGSTVRSPRGRRSPAHAALGYRVTAGHPRSRRVRPPCLPYRRTP